MTDIIDIRSCLDGKPPTTGGPSPPTDRELILVLNKSAGDLWAIVRGMARELERLSLEIAELKAKK